MALEMYINFDANHGPKDTPNLGGNPSLDLGPFALADRAGSFRPMGVSNKSVKKSLTPSPQGWGVLLPWYCWVVAPSSIVSSLRLNSIAPP